jgi:hypothetical protein
MMDWMHARIVIQMMVVWLTVGILFLKGISDFTESDRHFRADGYFFLFWAVIVALACGILPLIKGA